MEWWLFLNPWSSMGDFEHHTPFPNASEHLEWSFQFVRAWTTTGYPVIKYCHDNIAGRKENIFIRSNCCSTAFPSHSGEGMVELNYSAQCGLLPPLGCGSYLKSRLSSPLGVGEIYEVRYWLFLPEKSCMDSSLLKNAGIYLSLEPEVLTTHELKSTNYFFGNEVKCNQWIKAVHYIRALCPLEFITIGIFRNSSLPDIRMNSKESFTYYIDDVSVKLIPESEVNSNIQPTPFCTYFEKDHEEKLANEISSVAIYFNSNECILDHEDLKKIDSFYNVKSKGKNNVVFVLLGYTDDEGNDNEQLSHNRAQTVKEYLSDKNKSTNLEMLAFGKGVSTSGNNATEWGRQLNRKVVLTNSVLDESQFLYRKILHSASTNDIPSLTKFFHLWKEVVKAENRIGILLDPRLNSIHTLGVWGYLTDEIKNCYRLFPNGLDRFFLDSLFFEDQRYRTNPLEQLSGFINEVDLVNTNHVPTSIKELELADSLNLNALLSYFQKRPFPTISKEGRRPTQAAVYIILHSGIKALMQKYLPIIEQNCMKGEAEWEHFAMMTDRFLLLEGKPQLFGTQYKSSEEMPAEFNLYTVDNIDEVNKRRIRLGLRPIAH